MTDKPERMEIWLAEDAWPDNQSVIKAEDYDALAAQSAADKARIADLTEQRDSFQRVGIEAITARSDAIELLRAIHNGIHCDTLPGNLYQRLELMLFPAQQGKEGGV